MSMTSRAGVSVEHDRGFEFEAMASPKEVADLLGHIADGFRAKVLHVAQGAEDVTVHPHGDISLEIAARDWKGKARLEIVLAWRLTEADVAAAD